MYEPSHVIQLLVEIQKDVAGLDGKVDRLISDYEKVDKEVRDVRTTLNRAQGFGIAAVILIPIFAGFIWWMVGGQLTDIKNRLVNPQTTAASSARP